MSFCINYCRNLFIVFYICLVGCKGDGLTVGSNEPNDISSSPFDGKLYFQDSLFYEQPNEKSAYSVFDFSSNKLTPIIPGSGWYVSASLSSENFLRVDGGYTELSVYDKNGDTIFVHDLSSIGFEYKSIPRFSPDGQFIVVIIRDIYSYLTVMRPDGTLINSIPFKDIEVGSRDKLTSVNWTPEGQVVFAFGDGIYQLNDIFNDSYSLIRSGLYDEGDDAILNLSVSPDGRKLAFLAGSFYEGEGAVRVLSRTGQNLRKITVEGSRFHLLAWSPNSEYLAIAHGKIPTTDFCGSIWVVDSDIHNPIRITRLSESGDVQAYKIKSLLDGDMMPLCSGSGLDWRE